MKILTLIVVGIIAVFLGYWLGTKAVRSKFHQIPTLVKAGWRGFARRGGCSDKNAENKGPGLIERQAEEKKKHLEAILELFASGSGSVTNNQVEKMLGISDASAERYLDELEKMGKIRQVGTAGTAVSYEKI